MIDKTRSDIEIRAIYRYPVKGLSPELLERVTLKVGETLPFDRAYAIENGSGRFHPETPRHLPKINFLMLMRHERLAKLRTVFHDAEHRLEIRQDDELVASGDLRKGAGRMEIERFFKDYMQEELRGAPKLVFSAGHSFSDVAAKCLHIINMNSVRALENIAGRSLDPLRFRPNLIIDGPPAFTELDWVDRHLTQKDVKLNVFKRTERCAATNVDPSTAHRDMTIPALLKEHFGHSDFGVYARVEEEGEISSGTSLYLD
jgi:uncharacterized protein YcbX